MYKSALLVTILVFCLFSNTAFAEDNVPGYGGLVITNNLVDCGDNVEALKSKIIELETRLVRLEQLLLAGNKTSIIEGRNYQVEAVKLASEKAYRDDVEHVLVYVPSFVSGTEYKALEEALKKCYRSDVEKTVRGVFQGRIKREKCIIGPNQVEWRD